MKRILVALLVGVGLSGCTAFNRFFDIPSNETPVVVVLNGEVKEVTPDPLRFNNKQGRVTIYWQAKTGYRFSAKNGISIDGERIGGAGGRPDPTQNEIVECRPAREDLTEFSCVNRNSRPGIYKYTVRMETVEGK
ncbi:MAG: hypothetical protein ACXWVT_13990, partial [Burkholderiaceae bacterium]